MSYAFVISNVVDMRAEPSNRSERVNQALFGETVRTKRQKDQFWLVEQTDGYTGWISERFLKKATMADFENLSSALVVAQKSRICDRQGETVDPFFIYYGTRLKGRKNRDGQFVARLPDGRNIYVNASAIQPIMGEKVVPASRILTEARRFLGVPYLWGGITPAGFDCSGFVRAVLGRFEIKLARDTKDQIEQGEPVDRNSIMSGDLVFFPGHVGIAIGRDKLIHASRGGGGVRINTLTPGAEDYRADLDKSYLAARRILRCT